VQHLTGFELHEGDDAPARAAKRITTYLSLRVKAAGVAQDLTAVLDADEDDEPARRFLASDRRQEPERMADAYPSLASYTAGVSVRADAPVDLLTRLDREEALHAHLATATLRLPIAASESGGPDGVVALLAKCLRAGTALQVEFVAW
jgi:hypothetical protein